MNTKRLFILAGVLIAVLMLAAAFGCNKSETTDTHDNTGESQAMVTASPDGEITASPTLQPGETASADSTGSADNTEAGVTEGSGDVTEPAGSEGADFTPGPGGATQPAGSEQAPGPGTTIAPITSPGTTQSNETPRPGTTFVPATITPSGNPGTTPTPRPSSVTYTPAPTEVPYNEYEAHYAGEVIDCSNLHKGDTFYWTLDLLNEHSCMWSGQWLCDYPEQYMSVDSYSTTWSGSVTAAVSQTWDDEEAWSDKPAIVCNPEYMGQTGGRPVGEEGNMYGNVGMYITSFSYHGLQMKGSLIRFKFKLNETPPQSAMKHDSDGYYLEIPVIVIESTATIDGPNGNYTCVGHYTITSEPGRMYFKH